MPSINVAKSNLGKKISRLLKKISLKPLLRTPLKIHISTIPQYFLPWPCMNRPLKIIELPSRCYATPCSYFFSKDVFSLQVRLDKMTVKLFEEKVLKGSLHVSMLQFQPTTEINSDKPLGWPLVRVLSLVQFLEQIRRGNKLQNAPKTLNFLEYCI